MTAPELESVCLIQTVWRVGFQPTPWTWSGWDWSSNGRFPGRWDDLGGNFRTVYAGSSLLGCLLEVLACFRNDPRLALDLLDIAEDDQDKVLHSSVVPGTVPLEWLDGRTAATALMSGDLLRGHRGRISSGAVSAIHRDGTGLGPYRLRRCRAQGRQT